MMGAYTPEQAQDRDSSGIVHALHLGHIFVDMTRLAAGIVLADDVQDRRGRSLVADVVQGTVAYHADTDAMLNARIAQIDQLLSAQVNEIVLAAEFQK